MRVHRSGVTLAGSPAPGSNAYHALSSRLFLIPPHVRGIAVFPTAKCKLRQMKLERIKDFLLMESEFIRNQQVLRPKVRVPVVPDPWCGVPRLVVVADALHCRTEHMGWDIEQEDKDKKELEKVEEIRGSPLSVGNLEEIVDDNHCIISSTNGPEYYVSIMSFVDRDQLEPNCTVLLHNKVRSDLVGLG